MESLKSFTTFVYLCVSTRVCTAWVRGQKTTFVVLSLAMWSPGSNSGLQI